MISIYFFIYITDLTISEVKEGADKDNDDPNK